MHKHESTGHPCPLGVYTHLVPLFFYQKTFTGASYMLGPAG